MKQKKSFKSLFADHVEKMVFGLFAMIVLLILAKTSWSRYQRVPAELISEADKARDKIKSPSNIWAERGDFKIVDYSGKVNELFSPISPDPFEFSTVLFHPLYQKNEPRREPTYEAVQELMAKASLVPLSVFKPSETTTEEEETPDTNKDTNKPVDDSNEFGSRTTAATTPGGLRGPQNTRGGMPSQGGPRSERAAERLAERAAAGGLNLGRGGRGLVSGMADDDEIIGGGMMPGRGAAGLTSGSNVTSRGVRVVAVRGVFPVKQQVENFKKALHMPEADAASMLEILDFVLERQKAIAGPDPWKTPDGKDRDWETVSIDRALEVVKETTGVDPEDPVPLGMQDAVITMPLPMRLAGFWKDSATHPKIASEELKSKEELEAQNKLIESLEKTMQEGGIDEQNRPLRKGFARDQSDFRGLLRQVTGNQQTNSMLRKNMGVLNPDDDDSPMGRMGGGGRGANRMNFGGRNPNAQVNQLIGDAKYFLFRYLDFDVESGCVYRYRVKLQLRNPNADATEEQLAAADPALKKGPSRDTPWSNITAPVEVPRTFNYFLKDVERDPYREEKVKASTGKAVAQLSVFDWDLQLGTTVADTLNTYAFGSFISGEPTDPKKEALVLDLNEYPEEQLQKKKHTFSSNDVLLDVEPDLEIIPGEHPDLKFSSDKKGGVARLGLVKEALVFTSLCEIKILDPVSDRQKEEEWSRRVSGEREGKKVFKPGDERRDMALNPDDDGPGAGARQMRGARMPKLGRGRGGRGRMMGMGDRGDR